MQKKILISAGGLVLCSIVLVCQGIGGEKKRDEFSVEIQEQSSRVVLYTIYRGHYAGVGQTIQQLYALAGQKGIRPLGMPVFVYLNNPHLVPVKKR